VKSIAEVVHLCGGTREEREGKEVEINGWIHNKRDHGQLCFVDIRDHTGIVQCVSDDRRTIDVLEATPIESVVCIKGIVQLRTSKSAQADPQSLRGIEIKVTQITVLSKSHPLPFEVSTNSPINDELKHRYRFLYLRRTQMLQNLKMRADIIDHIRQWLRNKNFTEIQTPIITAPSPEGARDFLVSSYKFPGQFYALPQSPQVFKQLAMVSGIGRYFQIAPCFRDEDSRADRLAGEFYQVDIEASFASKADILDLTERLILDLFNKFNYRQLAIKPKIAKFTYQDALELYGTDKPDLRNPLQIYKLMSFKHMPPSVFSKSMSSDGVTLGLIVDDATQITGKLFEECKKLVVANNGPGLVFVTRREDGLNGHIAKTFSAPQTTELESLLQPGNAMILLSAFPSAAAYKMMGLLRDLLGERLDLIDKSRFEFAWVTDFPMYEYDKERKVQFAHNPFSKPKDGVKALVAHKTAPTNITAMQWDLVCNGREVASGASRNDSLEGLYKAFEITGYSTEMVDRSFPGLVTAYKYGVPPHSGIGIGLDRLIMLLLDAPNLRDIHFMPLGQSGEDKLMNAPRRVPQDQLRELSLSTAISEKDETQKQDVEIIGFFDDVRISGGSESTSSDLDIDLNNIEKNFENL
jgi:aspartyl-tRNA synthetase